MQDLCSVMGGDAASAYVCTSESGKTYFVKTVSSGAPFAMEALGLRRLKTDTGVRVPDVTHASESFLILEHLRFGSPGKAFQEQLGRQLALTHQQCRCGAYGFDEDHFIGKTPQKNTPQISWTPGAWQEFWWTHRLEPMIRRLHTPELDALGSALEKQLPSLIGPVSEKPCLIHGDLWSGNVAADEEGLPVMFDPAPSYSHREAELGMTRLFGGFTAAFYAAYHETFPLEDGWQDRQDLYMLYHVLNHAVLFGSSYLRQAHSICKTYV